MGRVVVVTGTPGTGKTAVARILAKRLGAKHVDLSSLVLSEGLYTGYDEDAASFIVDEEALVNRLKQIIEGERLVVIDSHYGEIVPGEYVEKVIVLRTDPEVLEERLRRRGWWWEKIRENVEAEILSVCTHNAIEAFGEEKVYEIDTTSKSPEEAAEEAIRIIRGGGKPGLRYDWLALKKPDSIEKYFSQ